MDEFRSGSLRILICTDPHAQGINVREPYLVINFDIPRIEDYNLRIASLCSSGRKSVVVNFVRNRDLSLIGEIKSNLFETRNVHALIAVPRIMQNGDSGNAFEFRVRKLQ
jgi:superfamily II DNA/RNA helicase